VSVLPVNRGGTVGVRAQGTISVRAFSEAARRLCDWESLTRNQKSTQSFFYLTPDARPVRFEKAVPPSFRKAAGQAFQRWQGGDRAAFPEVLVLLSEACRIKSGASPLLQPSENKTIRPWAAAITFNSEGKSIFVIGEARCRRNDDEAVLAEIHYFVADSYPAGVNVYHLKRSGEGRAELTVEIYCWIKEAAGFLGSLIPRRIASQHLKAHVRRTWLEVAAYLSGRES